MNRAPAPGSAPLSAAELRSNTNFCFITLKQFPSQQNRLLPADAQCFSQEKRERLLNYEERSTKDGCMFKNTKMPAVW